MSDTIGRTPWWQGAVLYQLYVRSWRDSDGDGYGDLAGIIERLDHLSWLGVDGIWLSPTMPSPDDDWGYDVSDYREVHPDLGTLGDLDALVAEAGSRSLRVLLDLVPNHTSSAHPWFIDAASGRDSVHRDYYVWADPKPGGDPPNNWLDSTGAPAWHWDAASGQYYLHNYLVSQPDLNWWLPAVHEEFREILEFWFDRGVAGFRIDVAHRLYKDAQLRDNPQLTGPDLLQGRFGLRDVYSANQPESHEIFRAWRQLAENRSPARLLLGETWVGDLDRLASFYGRDDELQLAFNFPFLFADFTAAALSSVVSRTLARLPAGACPVWTASNHDAGRFPTRWCGGDERKIKLALLVLATLPGTTVLYYGDEIGMTNVDVPMGLRQDKMTMDGGNPQGVRDRGRTPMQWDASASAGFTAEGVRPWLPSGDPSQCNVADQRRNQDSPIWLCRRLLQLRRAELGSGVAGFQTLEAPREVWAYRVGELAVIANFSDAPVDVGVGDMLLTTWSADQPDNQVASKAEAGRVHGQVPVPAWSGAVVRYQGPGMFTLPGQNEMDLL